MSRGSPRRALLVRKSASLIIVLATIAALAAVVGCDDKLGPIIDLIPPELEILTPLDGSEVSGLSFLVEVDATDDVAIERVTFQIIERTPLPLPDTISPYAVRLYTFDQEADSLITLVVTAFDAKGNTTT